MILCGMLDLCRLIVALVIDLFTAHPTTEWIASQLTAACGWEQVPRYLIRDRDALLRQHIRSPNSLARHSRSSHICALAMAERICRAADRLDTTGMLGPHCGDKRAAPSPHPPVLHGILQYGAHAPLVKEGCAQWKGNSAPRAYRRKAYAW